MEQTAPFTISNTNFNTLFKTPVTGHFFISKKDKETYALLQNKIQTAFLKDNQVSFTFTVSVPKTFLKGTDLEISFLEHQQDLTLSNQTYEFLLQGITNRGFNVHFQEETSSSRNINLMTVTVAIPTENRPLEILESAGWDPSFTVSHAKKHLWEKAQEFYPLFLETVKNTLTKDPDLNQYEFTIQSSYPEQYTLNKLRKKLSHEGIITLTNKDHTSLIIRNPSFQPKQLSNSNPSNPWFSPFS